MLPTADAGPKLEPVSVTTEPPIVDNGPDDDTLDTLGDAYVIVAVDGALD